MEGGYSLRKYKWEKTEPAWSSIVAYGVVVVAVTAVLLATIALFLAPA